MKEVHQILVAPHITESSTKNMLDARTGVYSYVFKVALDANKFEIKDAVEARFGVKVDSVRTLITRGKINPLIGACGISAFPMAARLSAKMAQEEDFDNFILMHAMGSNTAGQLGSVVAGGLLLVLVSQIGGFPI